MSRNGSGILVPVVETENEGEGRATPAISSVAGARGGCSVYPGLGQEPEAGTLESDSHTNPESLYAHRTFQPFALTTSWHTSSLRQASNGTQGQQLQQQSGGEAWAEGEEDLGRQAEGIGGGGLAREGGKGMASKAGNGGGATLGRARQPLQAQYDKKAARLDLLRRLNTSMGPKFTPEQGAKYVEPGDHGLAGLLSRVVKVSDKAWAQHMRAVQAGMRDRLHRSVFGLPVLHPGSKRARAWMAFMLAVDLVYTAFVVPINVAFCTISYGDSATNGCTAADLFGGIAYTLNLLFMLQCGLVLMHGHLKVTVLDGRDVLWHYCMSYKFLLDVVAIVPFIYLIVVLAGHLDRGSAQDSWVNLLSLVRLLRMVRMLSISRMVVADSAAGQYRNLPWVGRHLTISHVYVFLLGYILSVLINLLACILVLEANLAPDSVEVWWDSLTWENVASESQPYQWYSAVYWVITTCTGTGFGDVSPKNKAEKVLANINMVLGMFFFGLLVASCGNALTRASQSAAQLYKHRKKLGEVDQWLRGRQLGSELSEEVKAFFYDYWSKRNSPEWQAESSILSELPSHLRDKATEAITLGLIKAVPALGKLPHYLQVLLARCLRPVNFLPGQDICVEGMDADRMWICEKGGIVALQRADQISGQLEPDPEDVPGHDHHNMHHAHLFGAPMPHHDHPQPHLHSQHHHFYDPFARGSFRTSNSIRRSGSHTRRTAEASSKSVHRIVHEPHVLTTPCLIGDSWVLEPEVQGCGQRLWTYRAVLPCKAWELRRSDLLPLLHAFPQIKVTLLEYVRNRLCRELLLRTDDDPSHWAELPMALARALLSDAVHVSEAAAMAALAAGDDDDHADAAEVAAESEQMKKLYELMVELQRAKLETGELTSMLSTLVEVCVVQPWAPISAQEDGPTSPTGGDRPSGFGFVGPPAPAPGGAAAYYPGGATGFKQAGANGGSSQRSQGTSGGGASSFGQQDVVQMPLPSLFSAPLATETGSGNSMAAAAAAAAAASLEASASEPHPLQQQAQAAAGAAPSRTPASAAEVARKLATRSMAPGAGAGGQGAPLAHRLPPALRPAINLQKLASEVKQAEETEQAQQGQQAEGAPPTSPSPIAMQLSSLRRASMPALKAAAAQRAASASQPPPSPPAVVQQPFILVVPPASPGSAGPLAVPALAPAPVAALVPLPAVPAAPGPLAFNTPFSSVGTAAMAAGEAARSRGGSASGQDPAEPQQQPPPPQQQQLPPTPPSPQQQLEVRNERKKTRFGDLPASSSAREHEAGASRGSPPKAELLARQAQLQAPPAAHQGHGAAAGAAAMACAVCGHAICPVCASATMHPAAQLATQSAPTEAPAPVAAQPKRGSELSRALLAQMGFRAGGGPSPWGGGRGMPLSTGLGRSSMHLGASSIDRFHSLNVGSIPIQENPF